MFKRHRCWCHDWDGDPMPTRLQRVRAFLHGMWEFRTDFTTHYCGDLIETYDAGRKLAHRLTRRRWDWNH